MPIIFEVSPLLLVKKESSLMLNVKIDKKMTKEKRKKIWNDAEERRKQVEAGTYVKPKRKYKTLKTLISSKK